MEVLMGLLEPVMYTREGSEAKRDAKQVDGITGRSIWYFVYAAIS
jgi:hypothetical protein